MKPTPSMFATSWVPASVPSLFHTPKSVPSYAAKNSVAPTAVRSLGYEVAGPGLMSLTRLVLQFRAVAHPELASAFSLCREEKCVPDGSQIRHLCKSPEERTSLTRYGPVAADTGPARAVAPRAKAMTVTASRRTPKMEMDRLGIASPLSGTGAALARYRAPPNG